MTERLPPHSIEAEQGVLGCILLNPQDALPLVEERIRTPDAFYDLRHRTIFEVVRGMTAAQTPVDMVTVHQEIKDSSKLEDVGGLAYLASLQDCTPSHAHLTYYLEILVAKHTRRRLIAAASDCLLSAFDEDTEIGDVIAAAETAVMAVSGDARMEASPELMRDIARDSIARWQDAASGKPRTGIPFDVPGLGQLIRWADGSRFTVVGARPSVGKSSLLLHVADEAAKAGSHVGYVSLEMPAEELYDRIAARETGIPYKEIGDGVISESSGRKLVAAVARTKDRPILISDKPLSLAQISGLTRRWIQRNGIKALFVDYLGLVSQASGKQSLYEHTTAVSKGLKALAMNHGIAVIAAAQLNRNAAGDVEPRLSDLRDSGSVEQDADTVLLLSESPDRPGEITVNVAKQRRGPRGKRHVRFIAETCTFKPAIDE